jgi:hypothetical protein
MDGWMEGGRDGGREGEREEERWRQGKRREEGRREGGREGGRKGGRVGEVREGGWSSFPPYPQTRPILFLTLTLALALSSSFFSLYDTRGLSRVAKSSTYCCDRAFITLKTLDGMRVESLLGRQGRRGRQTGAITPVDVELAPRRREAVSKSGRRGRAGRCVGQVRPGHGGGVVDVQVLEVVACRKGCAAACVLREVYAGFRQQVAGMMKQ